jgi:tripartite-type tricarboxylate transporter receptor subunit TctC
MIRHVVLALTVLTAASNAIAQTPERDWPNHPVHFVVPFPAGGSTDTVARFVGQMLSARLGQQFVIDNRVGASGNLGTEAVARAAPDGYTIGLATTTTHALAPSFVDNLPFDPIKDFAPVSMLGSAPFVMVVAPSLPASTLKEFIALARAKPGGLSYGSAGAGSLAHLAAALFANLAGVTMVHVPYKASAQSVTDLMTGRLDMQFATVPPTLSLLRAGKLRALGIASAHRSALLPDVPTIAEAGLPGYEASLWMAVMAPAGTPAPIVTKLSREIAAVLQSPDGKEGLINQGVDAEPSTPDELRDRIRAEIAKWRDVIAKSRIKAQ